MDLILLRALAEHQPSWLVAGARAVMLLGMTWWGLSICLVTGTVTVFALRAWRAVTAAAAALVVGTAAARLFKALIRRPRPPADLALVHPGGWSFPSSQATETAALVVAFIVAGSLTGRLRPPPAKSRRVAIGLGAVALVLVGVSMVSLGAHWASDVLAGWALGGGIGVLAARATVPRGRRMTRPQPPTSGGVGPDNP